MGQLAAACARIPAGSAAGALVPPAAGCMPLLGLEPASPPPPLVGDSRTSGGRSGGSGHSAHSAATLDPTVRFYLSVMLAIAAANSLATLARAFSFAKGGLVAARVRRQLRAYVPVRARRAGVLAAGVARHVHGTTRPLLGACRPLWVQAGRQAPEHLPCSFGALHASSTPTPPLHPKTPGTHLSTT